MGRLGAPWGNSGTLWGHSGDTLGKLWGHDDDDDGGGGDDDDVRLSFLYIQTPDQPL